MKIETDEYYFEALKYSKSIQDLDGTTALNIALILAAIEPELYNKCREIAKRQNVIPKSTLNLQPVPKIPAQK